MSMPRWNNKDQQFIMRHSLVDHLRSGMQAVLVGSTEVGKAHVSSLMSLPLIYLHFLCLSIAFNRVVWVLYQHSTQWTNI